MEALQQMVLQYWMARTQIAFFGPRGQQTNFGSGDRARFPETQLSEVTLGEELGIHRYSFNDFCRIRLGEIAEEVILDHTPALRHPGLIARLEAAVALVVNRVSSHYNKTYVVHT